ncbi:MAG: ATP-dependent DNA ligase [Candidatus Pacebacteria bacterium]|nr:ATP-dependent DNA ligase [Candidatus Paceibacterota bacterium]
MLFAQFAQHLQKIEATSSRLEMTVYLAQLFKELATEEIPVAVYLSLGQLTPAYKNLEFQLSTKMVLRVLVQQMAQNPDLYGDGLPAANLFDEADISMYETKANQIYKKNGDIGKTAQEVFALSKNKNFSKTILAVYQDLIEVAEDAGAGSQERKINLLLKLFQGLDEISVRFVSRIVVGKLRLGFSTMTIFDALSWTKHQNKADAEFLEELFQRKADLGLLAQMYLQENDKKVLLAKYHAEFGVPIVPALCQRLNTAQEIIEKMDKVIVEPKYDGLRIQIHLDKKTRVVKSFTRNLEETSHMFPELKKALTEIDCDSCILDGEVVGLDKKTGAILPFQETATRRRKHGVDAKAAEIPVHFYIFDILFQNNQSLLDTVLTTRKAILQDILNQATTFTPTPFVVTSDAQELRDFHEEQLANGLEGAVMKKDDSLYKSGRKGWRWVKIKEAEGSKGKLNDTLDCVVMGYYAGRGKRAGFGLGAFLVGVVADNGVIETVAKIGTGLSDDQFREFKQRTAKLVVENDFKSIADIKPVEYRVHKNLYPDVWVRPGLVVEIAADEITNSQIHSAGQDTAKNIPGKALRFPRLVRFRDDKGVTEATTVRELASISHLV